MPIRDTRTTTKVLRDSDDIVTDLLKLRDDLYDKHKGRHISEEGVRVTLEINNCLYSGYTSRKHNREGTDLVCGSCGAAVGETCAPGCINHGGSR